MFERKGGKYWDDVVEKAREEVVNLTMEPWRRQASNWRLWNSLMERIEQRMKSFISPGSSREFERLDFNETDTREKISIDTMLISWDIIRRIGANKYSLTRIVLFGGTLSSSNIEVSSETRDFPTRTEFPSSRDFMDSGESARESKKFFALYPDFAFIRIFNPEGGLIPTSLENVIGDVYRRGSMVEYKTTEQEALKLVQIPE